MSACETDAEPTAPDVPGERGWSHTHRALWQRIAAHPFEHDGIALDFTRRLARTLTWSLVDTRRLVEEYRRFCFLAVVSDIGPVTPSEEVDEAWHLHLVYTRDYWERWCGEALGRPLHHDPTEGGPTEQARYRAQYAATLALYERWFGPPPAAFWPGTARRFAPRPRFRLVDTRGPIRLRPFGTRAAIAALLAFAATPAHGEVSGWEAANPFDFNGPTFLWLYAALMPIVFVVTWLLRDTARTVDRRPDLRDIGDVGLAYLAGGPARAADTLYLELAAHGAAAFEGDRIVVGEAPAGLPPRLEAFRAALAGSHTRADFVTLFKQSGPLADLVERMKARHILLPDARRARLDLVTWLPGALLAVFGLAKVFVGISRGKPVGFLFFMIAATGLAVAIARGRERSLTREARDCLAALRTSRSRALRAPTQDELPFSFAMLGAVALDGTNHASYARQIRPDGGSGGCGTSGGDGGGGGGCGGGGCGGCGS